MRSKANTSCLLLVAVLLAALCSCINDAQHLAFTILKTKEWGQGDTLSYIIPPLEGAGCCGVSLLLYTDGYEYENIAVDVTIRQDSMLRYHDLRSYLLSEDDPKEGVARRCYYTLPIDDVELCDTLPTVVTLTHQLDQPVLKGVDKVGVCIGKRMRQPGEVVWRVNWQ